MLAEPIDLSDSIRASSACSSKLSLNLQVQSTRRLRSDVKFSVQPCAHDLIVEVATRVCATASRQVDGTFRGP